MIEHVFKKEYKCELGSLKEGTAIRVMTYNGKPVVYYEGGMVNGGYADILLKIIKDSNLHNEYLSDREVIKNKV